MSSASSGEEAESSIFKAAEEGHLERVRDWIAGGETDVDISDSSDRTPLWYACSRGHLSIVELLAAEGATLDRIDRFGVTPLVVAVRRGCSSVVGALIRAGVDVDPEPRARFIPLHVAVEQSDTDIVFQLLAAGADPLVQQVTGDPANDLVRNAMIRSRLRGMALSSVLILGTGQEARLTFPIGADYERVGFRVLDAGRNVVFDSSIPGPVGPPELIVRWDHRDESGAEIQAGEYALELLFPDKTRISFPRRALHVRLLSLEDAAAYATSGAVIALSDLGEDLDARGVNGRTALMVAAGFGNVETATALIELGADTDLRDTDGRSAFDYAEQYAPGQKIGQMLERAVDRVRISR